MEDKLIEKTYDLLDEIKSTPAYQGLLTLNKQINADEHVKQLITLFKTSEAKYNDAKRYGKHHPDLKQYKAEFQKASYELFRHPLVKQYKVYERELNTLLETIASELAAIVSPRLSVKKSLSISNLGGQSCKSEVA